VFFEGEGGGGGGGGASDDPPARQNPADVAARYSGDAVRMASQIVELERDNYNLRSKNRDFKAEVETLKGKVPGEGAVVLTADQAKALEAYQKLGKPDELATQLEAGRTALAESDTFKKAIALEQAAKVANFKPGVLKLLGRDLNIEIREVEVQKEDGTTEKKVAAFVKLQDAAGAASEKPLRDYFKEQGEDVLSSLEAGEVQLNGSMHDAQAGAQSGGFTPYPAQGAGSPAEKAGFGALAQNRYAHNIPKTA